MRTLHEILLSELNTAYPLDTLDNDFDALDYDCLVEHVAAEECE